jgi:hypothetical protein
MIAKEHSLVLVYQIPDALLVNTGVVPTATSTLGTVAASPRGMGLLGNTPSVVNETVAPLMTKPVVTDTVTNVGTSMSAVNLGATRAQVTNVVNQPVPGTIPGTVAGTIPGTIPAANIPTAIITPSVANPTNVAATNTLANNTFGVPPTAITTDATTSVTKYGLPPLAATPVATTLTKSITPGLMNNVNPSPGALGATLGVTATPVVASPVVSNPLGINPAVAPGIVNNNTGVVGSRVGIVNVIDGKVIMHMNTLDDPIFAYMGDLVLDYSYYKVTNGNAAPIRVSNLVEPIDLSSFRLIYSAADNSLTVDGTKKLRIQSLKVPSILAAIYLLSKNNYIDPSYAVCVNNYVRIFELCVINGLKFELLRGPDFATVVDIDNPENSFRIAARGWDTTTVNQTIMPFVQREFYIVSLAGGIVKVCPFMRDNLNWCTLEFTNGNKCELLWEALAIYVVKMFLV